MKTHLAGGLAVAAYLLAAVPVPAQESGTATSATTATKKKDDNKNKPVDIEADKMEIQDKENKAIFTGNVHAKRPDVTLDCDLLVVDFVDTKQADGTSKTEVANLDATGNVVIVTERQKITGEHATMDPRTDILVVTGNVVLTQGKTVLRGPKLNANLKTNKMDMTGGRVKGSFVPSSN